MFFNDPFNRSIVQGVVDEYSLDLVDPEIFLRFINEDLSIQTWEDVYREMQFKNTGFFPLSRLKRQYKLCGFYLKGKGYTEFSTSKI